jgi:hypothetical protein
MPAQHTDPWDLPVPREAVAESLGGAYWSVDECRWETVAPALPDDLVDLLAPPIVVGCSAGHDGNAAPPESARPGEDATRPHQVEMLIFDSQHPMIAPALPRRVGRHRRASRVG